MKVCRDELCREWFSKVDRAGVTVGISTRGEKHPAFRLATQRL